MILGMPSPDTPLASWQAKLNLAFERRNDETILARREFFGPLRVQKPLYPEGREVCQVIVLHPPAGIAGGDQLALSATMGVAGHALLTTPGAGKWYRSAGPWATQKLDFRVESDAVLEWLPQETIVFDGALGRMETRVDLAPGALYLGWEILCLGRRAGGETFTTGELALATDIRRDGQLLWRERGRLAGGSPLLDSPVGLNGFSVAATLLAAGREIPAPLVTACREIAAEEENAQTGLSALPHLLVARYLGHSSEAARHWFTALWQQIRPTLAGRDAQPPRIWNT